MREHDGVNILRAHLCKHSRQRAASEVDYYIIAFVCKQIA